MNSYFFNVSILGKDVSNWTLVTQLENEKLRDTAVRLLEGGLNKNELGDGNHEIVVKFKQSTLKDYESDEQHKFMVVIRTTMEII